MMILGVDPAVRGPAGLCLYDGERFVDAGVVTFSPQHGWERRCEVLLGVIREWAATHDLGGIACEGAYLEKNAQTAIKLAHAGGAVRGLAFGRGLAFAMVSTLDTRAVLATIPPALLAPILAPIRAPLRDHAACAAAIALHGAGIIARRQVLEAA